jgi:lipopolysaccharide export system permease protein
MTFDLYLLRQFLKTFSLLSFFFIGLYCVIDFLEKNTRYFPKYGASGRVILEFYVSQLPKLFVDLLPFAVLFSTIVVLWTFARSGEIAAMRAAGRSTLRICAPVIFAGFLLSLGSFLLREFVVPRALNHLKKVETVKIEKAELGKLFFESNWVKGDHSVLHFKALNQVKQRLEGIEHYVMPEGSSVSDVRVFQYAQYAQFNENIKVWVLFDVSESRFDEKGILVKQQHLDSYHTNVVSKPPKLLGEGVTADQIGYFELRALVNEARKGGGALKRLEVELYQKLALPFANLIFVFFALSFALRRERQTDTYLGVLACLLAAILYWVGNLALRNLAVNGVVPPFLGAWLVTWVLLVGSYFVVRRLDTAL